MDLHIDMWFYWRSGGSRSSMYICLSWGSWISEIKGCFDAKYLCFMLFVHNEDHKAQIHRISIYEQDVDDASVIGRRIVCILAPFPLTINVLFLPLSVLLSGGRLIF